MNINQTIHEAMGLLKHEIVTDVFIYPNYADPIPNAELMDWMRENSHGFLLDEYCKAHCTVEPIDIGEWINCDRHEQVALIAEAIREGVLK